MDSSTRPFLQSYSLGVVPRAGLEGVMDLAQEMEIDFVCAYMAGSGRVAFDPHSTLCSEEWERVCVPPISVPDIFVGTSNLRHLVVGRFSHWIDVDNPDAVIRDVSRKAFVDEFENFIHLGISTIMVEVKDSYIDRLVRTLADCISAVSRRSIDIWVVIPTALIEVTDVSVWKIWQRFRSICVPYCRTMVCLKLTGNFISQRERCRWIGEPVVSFWLPENMCSFDDEALYLQKQWQIFIRHLLSVGCKPIVSILDVEKETIYLTRSYLNCQLNNCCPVIDVAPWLVLQEDSVFRAMECCFGRLTSETYEFLEKDVQRYHLYKDALAQVLLDDPWVVGYDLASGCEGSPVTEKVKVGIKVVIVGAGRGAILGSCIAALKEHNDDLFDFKLYAFEDNAGARVSLNFLRKNCWSDWDITVVPGTVADYRPCYLADIIVVDVVTSFGDYRLCADIFAASSHLMKSDTICMPSMSTVYMAPFHSTALHRLISGLFAPSETVTDVMRRTFDQPYLFSVRNGFLPCQPCAVFNLRYPEVPRVEEYCCSSLVFKADVDVDIVGLQLYFDCVLYKGYTHMPAYFSMVQRS